MQDLLLLITIAGSLFLIARAILLQLRNKPVRTTLKRLGLLLGSYLALWLLFLTMSGERTIPFGEEICFDDWCAAVNGFQTKDSLDSGALPEKGRFVILDLQLHNKARRVAQRPSEPRVYIADETGQRWTPSLRGQQALQGEAPLDTLLAAGQTVKTRLIFDLPLHPGKYKVILEEGPFITRLLLPGDRLVYVLE